MIELLCVESVGGFRLRLAFSDGSEGVFDAGDFVRQSVLTASPIRVSEVFPAKCAGARELHEIMWRRLPVLARPATPDRAFEHATL